MSSAADSDSHLQSLVLRLGNFQTQMSFLGCIGHLMGGARLQEAFELVYAENVVVHILNGKAYSRAVRAHLNNNNNNNDFISIALFHVKHAQLR